MKTIQEQLREARNVAWKNNDKCDLSTIRMMIDRIEKKEKDSQTILTDSEAIQILQTFKKQIAEEKEFFKKADHKDKVIELVRQEEVVSMFLPAQMTHEEILNEIRKIVNSNSDVKYNKGSLMKVVMPVLKGKADNKTISDVVGEFLNG